MPNSLVSIKIITNIKELVFINHLEVMKKGKLRFFLVNLSFLK
jgi:hypothetical protein